MPWQNKRLDLEYGPTVPLQVKVREMSVEERFKAIARSPEMMRKFEERLDRNPDVSEELKRRSIQALKRMAGIDDADDMAPLVEELRRLTAEMEEVAR